MTTIIRLEAWLSDDLATVEGAEAQYDISYAGDPYVFVGKEFTYVVWHQWPYHSVTRWTALKFATMHHEGKLKTLSLDLRTL